MVLTRHDSHASFVVEALRSDKFVYVEKPLALSPAELGAVRAALLETGNDGLMVGYNRRFAPLLTQLRDAFDAEGPVQITYHVNAGRLDPTSWYADAAQHGSRFVGEGGHFVDTISWWIGHDPVSVSATASGADPDDLQVTLAYPDGSVGHIAYLTQGDPRFPKERMTVTGAGRVALLDNFTAAELWHGGKRKRFRRMGGTDKGQATEMGTLVDVLRAGQSVPISLDSMMATSAATFAAAHSATTGSVQEVADFLGSESEQDA